MAYCKQCGVELKEGASFCHKCGHPIIGSEAEYSRREKEFVGKIYKCPNCGEILKAFEINCPSCGFELRSVESSSAIKEFELKLEAIESRRDYERPEGFFAATEAKNRVSKTDEQKISLIKGFAIPNSKEDMLEFMIIATSSLNMRMYDSYTTKSKGEQEVNAAWFSKVQQVYEKAKRIYSTDNTFEEIKDLYDNCNKNIKKAKKKGIIKWVLMIGWLPLLWIIIIVDLIITNPQREKEEISRMENIEIEVQTALERGEYKLALRTVDSMDYQGYDIEQERKWDIKREYWADKVLEEAGKNGVKLEYIPTKDIDNANKNDSSKGEDESGFSKAKSNIEEFIRTMNKKESDE